jgi:hypothetical protein
LQNIFKEAGRWQNLSANYKGILKHKICTHSSAEIVSQKQRARSLQNIAQQKHL